MGGIIGDILPYAVGVAVSPVPIIAVILMLFSTRASANAPAFLAGWVVGLLAVTVIVLMFSNLMGVDGGAPPTWVSLLKVVLGALLLLLGYEKLQGRPPAGAAGPLPKWLGAVDRLTPGTSFAMGALLSGVNPKNLILAAAAALAIAQAGRSTIDTLMSVLAFVVIGSLSIGVPVLYARMGGSAARARLDAARAWLGINNATVMAVLLLVFGVMLIGQGLGGL